MFRLRAALFMVFLYLGLGSICAKESVDIADSGPENWLDMEATLVKNFETYLDKLQQKYDNINRFLNYVEVLNVDLEDTEEYFGNPLNAFTTINRLVNNWKREVFDILLSSQHFESYEQQLNTELKELNIEGPTSDNLLDTTSDLAAFQISNSLSTSDLANGLELEDQDPEQVKVKSENLTLSASDCYAIGRNLYQLGDYDYATEWLLLARSRASQDPVMFPKVSDVHILEHLASTFEALGSIKLAKKLNKEILKTDPTHEAALQNIIKLESKLIIERSEIQNIKVEL